MVTAKLSGFFLLDQFGLHEQIEVMGQGRFGDGAGLGDFACGQGAPAEQFEDAAPG